MLFRATVHDDGLDDEMCNILMIDELGEKVFMQRTIRAARLR
ncbi:hypothetical protein [Enterobacter phage N5822]|nr:hypothetical protein [Enterobacter phage N5822]